MTVFGQRAANFIGVGLLVSGLTLSACDDGPGSKENGQSATATTAPEESRTPEIEVLHIGTPDGLADETKHPDRGLEGHWVGQYKCGQGAMNLDVQIKRQRGSGLMATVAFEPSKHAVAGVEAGTWQARMIFTESSRIATFEPDSWVDQPDESYQMLLLKGRLDRPELHITGDVLGQQSCSKFTLNRKGAHPYTGIHLEEETEVVEEVATDGVLGRWAGSYNCGGNKMNLKITVNRQEDESIKADVLFSPDEGDTSGLTGGHWVAAVEENGPGASIRMVPTTWVTEPDMEYKMLEFSGRLNEDADQITGDIANQSGCSNVILRRPSHKAQ
jgi:hypothetical protein